MTARCNVKLHRSLLKPPKPINTNRTIREPPEKVTPVVDGNRDFSISTFVRDRQQGGGRGGEIREGDFRILSLRYRRSSRRCRVERITRRVEVGKHSVRSFEGVVGAGRGTKRVSTGETEGSDLGKNENKNY